MSRDEGGHWLPIHTGLLDDERFMEAGAAREAWVVLYLALDREPQAGWFKDRARVLFLLRKHGVAKPESKVAILEAVGWLVAEHDDSPRLTLRKWDIYSGASARKAVYNRDRATTRDGRAPVETPRAPQVPKGRRTRVETRRAPVETGGDLDETRRDENNSAGARDAGAARARGGDTRSFKEILAETGFDPSILAGEPPKRGTS